jgi:hypothetical protein
MSKPALSEAALLTVHTAFAFGFMMIVAVLILVTA